MDDVQRQDLKLFLRELAHLSSLVLIAFGGFLLYSFYRLSPEGVPWFQVALAYGLPALAVHSLMAYRRSRRKRFLNSRYEAIWKGCCDRLERFHQVMKKLKRDQIADLREVPKTMNTVSRALYKALRRADLISHEVNASEKGLFASPAVWNAQSNDPQSNELYRIADRNLAEYRQQLAGVLAGVQRTEAQSAVFMTTVDTLRIKMQGYRLVGKSPELTSHDFLEALTETKLQLQSIDKALDELELGPYPKMIAVMPPVPMPEDVQQQIDQR